MTKVHLMYFKEYFLIKEILRRKKSARKDVAKCVKIANSIGLKQKAGTKEFPVFGK